MSVFNQGIRFDPTKPAEQLSTKQTVLNFTK